MAPAIRRRRPRLMLLAAGAMLLGGCANSLTDALIEAPLGKLSELGVSLQFRMDDDPLLRGYVRRIGAEQRTLARRTDVPYRWSLVDLDAPNAFAIPYGGIYVTRGLLRFADTEDEIAFVMGHEMGHVERRHGSLAFQRSILIGIGLSLVTSNNNADWMQYAYLGNALLDLHFSRENEHSADRNGAMYSVMGGFDPYAAACFFAKLDDRYGATPRFWSYLETHPINRDRVSYLARQPYLSETDPTMLTRIAQGYLDRSLLRSAERHYREALRVDPQYAAAYLGLARVQAHRSEVATARASYRQALAYGADEATVNAELALLDSAPAVAEQPSGGLIVASRRELDEVRTALARLETDATAARAAALPVISQPLDAARGLVAGHHSAGGRLDELYRVSEGLPKDDQEAIIAGQKLRALTLRAAAEVASAQEQAGETLDLVDQNRERLLARLAAEPSGAAVATGRHVLLDSQRAEREVRDAVGRLREQVPAVARTIEEGHDTIRQLHAGAGARSGLRLAGPALEAVAEQTRDAMRRTTPALRALNTGRTRALQSSIDITMLDRSPWEKAVAQQVLCHFTLTEPDQLAPLLQDGLTYGEAAYVLALATSGEDPAGDLLTYIEDDDERQTVDRLFERGRGRTSAAAIMMRLIDNTLKDEFDYAYGTRLAKAQGNPTPAPAAAPSEERPPTIQAVTPDEPRGGPRDVAPPRRNRPR